MTLHIVLDLVLGREVWIYASSVSTFELEHYPSGIPSAPTRFFQDFQRHLSFLGLLAVRSRCVQGSVYSEQSFCFLTFLFLHIHSPICLRAIWF